MVSIAGQSALFGDGKPRSGHAGSAEGLGKLRPLNILAALNLGELVYDLPAAAFNQAADGGSLCFQA